VDRGGPGGLFAARTAISCEPLPWLGASIVGDRPLQIDTGKKSLAKPWPDSNFAPELNKLSAPQQTHLVLRAACLLFQ